MFLAISILYGLISDIYLGNIPEIKYVVMKKIVMDITTSKISYLLIFDGASGILGTAN
jgi:hypothetical protein